MKHHKSAILVGMLVAVALVIGCGGLREFGPGGGGSGGVSGVLMDVDSDVFVFDLSGGRGNTGTGGKGNGIWCETFGTDGITAGTAGSIDTRFTMPADPPGSFGTEQLVVSSNLTIDVYQNEANAEAGAGVGRYVMLVGNSTIYRVVTAAPDVAVDGIHVKPGVTLTLGLNADTGGNTGLDYADVSVSDDIKIEGVLTAKDLTAGNPDGGALVSDVRHGDASASAADMGGIQLACANFIVTAAGRIDLAGPNAAAVNTRGGDGGWIYVDAGGNFVHGSVDATGGNGWGTGEGGEGAVMSSAAGPERIRFESVGIAVNSGTLDASGGNAGSDSNGGDAGRVYLEAGFTIYNTGTLRCNGGAGTTGNGGDAHGFYFCSYSGSVYNAGRLEGNGGRSTDGNGGGGAEVELYAGYSSDLGRVLNSGAIEARGGDSTNGSGGSGSYVYSETYGGDFRSVRTIDLRGGSGSDTGGESGGDGGYIDVYTYEGYDNAWSLEIAPGDIIICGNVYLGGGSGDDGGDAGYCNLFCASDDGFPGFGTSADNFPITAGIFAYGYRSFNTGGGDGADGGNASYFNFGTWVNDVSIVTGPVAAGPITIEADCSSSGGRGTNGTGGNGDDFWTIVDYNFDDVVYDLDAAITIIGDITVEGGDGTVAGGNGVDLDCIYILNYGNVEITGDISCRGGDGTGIDADGGDGDDGSGDIFIESAFGSTGMAGNIDAGGGRGRDAGTGGNATSIEIYAERVVRVTGHVDASGGDVLFYASGSQGGDASWINIESLYGSSVGSYADVTGGTAETDGSDGTFTLDGTDYSP